MNHNKIHAKIMLLLTLPSGKIWGETVPALIILAVIGGLSYLPFPSVFNLTSCIVALIMIVGFNLTLSKNRIVYDEEAIRLAPTVEEEPVEEITAEVEDIKSEPLQEEVVEPKKEVLTEALPLVEDVEDLFNFNAKLTDTYNLGSPADMASASKNHTNNKANSML